MSGNQNFTAQKLEKINQKYVSFTQMLKKKKKVLWLWQATSSMLSPGSEKVESLNRKLRLYSCLTLEATPVTASVTQQSKGHSLAVESH